MALKMPSFLLNYKNKFVVGKKNGFYYNNFSNSKNFLIETKLKNSKYGKTKSNL